MKHIQKRIRSFVFPGKHDPNADDPCVLCGGKTGFKRSEPTDRRMHYIEGAGQLCSNCYRKTYRV